MKKNNTHGAGSKPATRSLVQSVYNRIRKTAPKYGLPPQPKMSLKEGYRLAGNPHIGGWN